MKPNTVDMRTSPPVPYTDHSRDYVPKTDPWNSYEYCKFTPKDDTEAVKTCCSDTRMLERVIDRAYTNGVQWHRGIAAIQDFPCVSQSELAKLSKDLGRVTKKHGFRTPTPALEGIDVSRRPYHSDGSGVSFCREVVFENLARELGKIVDSKPISFTKEVLVYCKHILTLPRREQFPYIFRADAP